MRNFSTQLEQIQLLIDRVQHHFGNNLNLNKNHYEKLLMLSEQIDYPYGKALAHIYLAQYFLENGNDSEYLTNLERGREIAESRNYFDVLLEYYRLEGMHNSSFCNETTALSIHLKGLRLAKTIKDKKQSAVFCNNIGEIFCQSQLYEEAERFFTEALESLEGISIKHIEYYKKPIIINLLHLFCCKKDEEKAKQYYQLCSETVCKYEHISLLFAEKEIRFLLLKGKQNEAKQKIQILKNELLNNHNDSFLLRPVYMGMTELSILMRQEEYASWCLQQISQLYEKLPPNIEIEVKNLQVMYSKTFDILRKKSFSDFYETTQENKVIMEKSTGESLKNLFAVYEADKEEKRMKSERTDLKAAINQDELTKIFNRRYINKLMSKVKQNELTKAMGIIMIDVDCFKGYNDCYGHSRADTILVQIAEILSHNLPKNAYAARYGGDEFVCLFVDQNEIAMIQFVESVQSNLKRKKIEHRNSTVSDLLTLTFGICHSNNLGEITEQALYKKADEALYQAKENGRNTYAIYR